MSNDVSFVIYCTPEGVPDVIRAASVAVMTQETIRVTLPTGHVMDVPADPFFWSRMPDAPTKPVPVQDASIAWVFRFPVDDHIRAYNRQNDNFDLLFWLDGREYIRLGYVYLFVNAGVRFARVSFLPASRDMARLFENSPTIRGYFLDVLDQSNALGGAIEGWGVYCLLEDPSREIAVQEHYSQMFLDPRVREEKALDSLIGHILQQIELARRSA